MAEHDPYAYWRAALEGKAPFVAEDDPQPGFYEASSPKKLRREACAIWHDAQGNLVAVKNGEQINPVFIWPSISHKPITEATYRAVERGEGWPETQQRNAS